MHVRLLKGTAPTQGFGDGPGPLPPCYHWSTYYHGLCVWNEICTGLCRRQDRSQFIRGTCRGYPAKCFCLSCWPIVVVVGIIIVLPPCNVVIWPIIWDGEIKLLELYTKTLFYFSSMIIIFVAMVRESISSMLTLCDTTLNLHDNQTREFTKGWGTGAIE